MLNVAYVGRKAGLVRYVCRTGATMHGLKKCISFGGIRPDQLVAQMLLEAVQPLAIEAAFVAQKQATLLEDERRRALELELEQASYSARIAQRRYEAVDPDNRLVASELEARWNHTLEHLRECEERCNAQSATGPSVSSDELLRLADDLEGAWSEPGTTMQLKQRLVRTLVEEIIVDVDDATREVVLVIHWKGGSHSEHRVRKPRTGEHLSLIHI